MCLETVARKNWFIELICKFLYYEFQGGGAWENIKESSVPNLFGNNNWTNWFAELFLQVLVLSIPGFEKILINHFVVLNVFGNKNRGKLVH